MRRGGSTKSFRELVMHAEAQLSTLIVKEVVSNLTRCKVCESDGVEAGRAVRLATEEPSSLLSEDVVSSSCNNNDEVDA